MNKKLSLIISIFFLTFLSILLLNPQPNNAQSCVPLNVVGGTGTAVQKSVSPPGVPPLSSNNWNTDFDVPANQSFRQFIATIQSNSTDVVNFPVEMFLKYGNNTADQSFRGNVQINPSSSKTLIGNPRKGEQPFQVNLRIGSTGTIGYSYTLSVKGCR